MDAALLTTAPAAPPRPPTAPAQASRTARTARAYDRVLVAATAVVVLGGLARWFVVGAPALRQFAPAVLASSMALIAVVTAGDDRTLSRLVSPTVLGVSLAVITSPVVSASPHDLFPLWALCFLTTVALTRRFRVREEVPLLCTQVLAGAALVLASHLPGPVSPTGRVLVGAIAYAAASVPLAWTRERLHGRTMLPNARSETGLRLTLAAAAYAVGTVAALNWLHADPDNRWAAVVLVATVVFIALVAWQATILSSLRRTSRALLRAVRTTPWPADRIDTIMKQLVSQHVRVEEVVVSSAPGTKAMLSEQVTDGRWLVARRRLGDHRFTRLDASVVAGIASLGRTSYTWAETEARLRTEAVTDKLTGLWQYPAWRSFFEAQSALRADGELIGIVFFDLDHFKEINETFGHLRADVVLATIGERLRGMSRQWRFGRFGGDEFVGFRRDVRDDAHLDTLCEELRRVVAEPVRADGRDIVPSITVGRTLSAGPAENPGRIVARAERDVRQRKSARPQPEKRSDRDLVQALLDGGLRVAFQPVIDLADDSVHGYEALLRSDLPGIGQVPPVELVAAARNVGALDTLTLGVAEEALAVVARACEKAGRLLNVGINLESDQLHWGNAALEWLAEAAQTFPGGVVVEITDRGDTSWEAEQYEVVADLESRGLAIALDDYGAGQSRLRAVARRRWHAVKLDRDFLTTDEPGLVMLRHNVQAMHELGQTVLLEGLETQEQVDLARSLGIDLGQGYLLGRPMSGEELLAALPGLAPAATAAPVAAVASASAARPGPADGGVRVDVPGL